MTLALGYFLLFIYGMGIMTTYVWQDIRKGPDYWDKGE